MAGCQKLPHNSLLEGQKRMAGVAPGFQRKQELGHVLRTADGFIGLVMIPFIDAIICSSWYAPLPMYLNVELKYSLATLGVVSGVTPIIRMLVPLLGSYLLPGRLEILKMPLQMQCIASGIFNLMQPTSELAIYLHLYSVIMLMQRSMYQAIAVRVWKDNKTSALRVAESCFTVGYCLGSLWSGGAYHQGGWVAVLWVQVTVLSLAVVLETIFLPQLRPSCGHASDVNSQASDLTKARAGTSAGAESLSIANQVKVCPDGEEEDEHTNRRRQEKVQLRQAKTAAHESDRMCWFVCLGMFLFVFGYAVEWAIYAVYLSRKFGFNTLTMGAGQMAGDMGGAILLLSTTSRPLMTRALQLTKERQQREEREEPRTWYEHLSDELFRLPFAMLWIALLYAGSFFTFASNNKYIAMGSQIIMGTLFVLSVQGISELLLWLTWRGVALAVTEDSTTKLDPGGYRSTKHQHFLAMSDIAYSSAVSLGNFVPFLLLDAAPQHVDWLLYVCGIGIAVYVVLYTVLFAADRRKWQQQQQQQMPLEPLVPAPPAVAVAAAAPPRATSSTSTSKQQT
jgi:hypothetical protein